MEKRKRKEFLEEKKENGRKMKRWNKMKRRCGDILIRKEEEENE